MKIAQIAPFPPIELWNERAPEEWEACLDAWIAVIDIYLRLPGQDFKHQSTKDDSLVAFITSYARERSHKSGRNVFFDGDKSQALRRKYFLLAHRFLSEDVVPTALLSWSFLADLSFLYVKSVSLRRLLSVVWNRHAFLLESNIQDLKRLLVKELDNTGCGKSDAITTILQRIGPLLHVSSDISRFFMLGSDLVDAFFKAYMKSSALTKKRILACLYLGLISLLEGEKPNLSLLCDHLYGLKSLADIETRREGGAENLLSDLVTHTALVRKMQDSAQGADAARAENLLMSLGSFRLAHGQRQRIRGPQRIDKGKGRLAAEVIIDRNREAAFDSDIHVHKMSLVTQIQDIFPDLGVGFIIRLLDEYGDNAELVTTHLLEGSLPPHLHDADRTESFSHSDQSTLTDLEKDSTSLSLPSRRNVFDNDDFDKLAVDASRFHIGRKNEKQTADDMLADRSTAPKKAAILAALAAFDFDDDERDDTYDVEDVGGIVDTAGPAGDPNTDLRDEIEEALFRAYRQTPDILGRDATTRRARGRQILKEETRMTDEAIEGWAVMLTRDPKRLRRLEAKYAVFSGSQRELRPTAYRASPADSGTEGSDGEGVRNGRGGYTDKARSERGGTKGRGDAAGHNGERDTQMSRQRKEANKGSRANHSRRDQRARKMARGGFPS